MKEILINHFLDYEFVYIFLFCSIIFLLISIFIKKKIIKKISIFFFSFFFVLCAFEFMLSFFMNKIIDDVKLDFSSCFDTKQVNKYREIKIKSKVDGNMTLIGSDSYDIELYDKIYDTIYYLYGDNNFRYDGGGNNGFRYVECDKSSKDTYVFFGCSFVFGNGLSNNETLPYYFSELYNFNKNIVNCGVRGRSSNTALNILNNEIFLSLMDEKSNIKHFFYFVIHDHIYRNFRVLCNELSDCYILKDKKYIITNVIVKFKFFLARSYIFRKIFLPIVDENLKLYYEDYLIKSLEDMNKIIEEKYNSKLTIIVWPEFEDNILNRLKETNLDLVSLPEYFCLDSKYRVSEYDLHPSAKANKEIAEILYNHIKGKDSCNKE